MLRSFFRLFVTLHVRIYRLTGGKLGGRVPGMRVLLITTSGRKSGRERTTPLGFFQHDGGYVVVASNGGSDVHPAWFLNLQSTPRAVVQVGPERFEAAAEVIGPLQRGPLWARLIEIAPAYDRYTSKTHREIPLVILRPTGD